MPSFTTPHHHGNRAQISRDLEPLASTARRTLGARAVIISARRPGDSKDSPVAVSGIPWTLANELQETLGSLGGQDKVLAIEDLSGEGSPIEAGNWTAQGFQSLAAAPLVTEDGVVGALYVLDDARIDGGRTDLITSFARHAAFAVSLKELSRQTSRLSLDLQALTTLDELVLTARDWEEMDRALTKRLAPITGAQAIGIMVWDPTHDILRTMPGAFDASEDIVASFQISCHDPNSNSARVFSTGEPYMSNHAKGDPAIMQEWVQMLLVERLISVPLKLKGRPIGVLHLANKPGPFTRTDLERAELVAPRVATVVQLGKAMFNMRRQASIEETLSRLAMGVALGDSMSKLLPAAFERLAEAIDAALVALQPVEGAPICWHTRGLARSAEVDALKAAEQKDRLETATRPPSPGNPGRGALYNPVYFAGRKVGALVALRLRADPFTAEEQNALRRLSNITALAWATETQRHQGLEIAQLRERLRIADDLHDRVAQILFGAQLNLESLLERNEVDPDTGTVVAHTRELLLKGDQEIREVIHQLSPPDDRSLAHRLAQLVASVERDFPIKVHVDAPDQVLRTAEASGQDASRILFRAAKEALVNAGKHAGPCTVDVILRVTRRGRLLLTVADDGAGFRTGGSTRCHGLESLRRALRTHNGMLRIASTPGHGTRLSASVPL